VADHSVRAWLSVSANADKMPRDFANIELVCRLASFIKESVGLLAAQDGPKCPKSAVLSNKR
jgi:hypothetical protein